MVAVREPSRKQQKHRARVEPPQREREGVRRRSVEPLEVVDRDDRRALLGERVEAVTHRECERARIDGVRRRVLDQERSFEVVRKGGILVSTVGVAAPEAAAARGIEAKSFLVHPDAAQLAEIIGLIDAGKVRLDVGTIFPLARAREAHELVQSGRARGKVVLKVA